MLFIFILLTFSSRNININIEHLQKLNTKYEEMQLYFSYYIYSVFFRYSNLNYTQIYDTYYKSLIKQKEKIFYIEKTNIFFNVCTKKMCNNSIPLEYEDKILKPIQKFLKYNPSLLYEKDNVIMCKHILLEKENGNKNFFVKYCIWDFVYQVVYKIILESENFEYFIEYVSLNKSGYYYLLENSEKFPQIQQEEQTTNKISFENKNLKMIYLKSHNKSIKLSFKILDMYLIYFIYIFHFNIYNFKSGKMEKEDIYKILQNLFYDKCDLISTSLIKKIEFFFAFEQNRQIKNEKIYFFIPSYKFIYRDKNEHERNLLKKFLHFIFNDDEIELFCIKYIQKSIYICYKELNKIVLEKNKEIESRNVFIYKFNS